MRNSLFKFIQPFHSAVSFVFVYSAEFSANIPTHMVSRKDSANNWRTITDTNFPLPLRVQQLVSWPKWTIVNDRWCWWRAKPRHTLRASTSSSSSSFVFHFLFLCRWRAIHMKTHFYCLVITTWREPLPGYTEGMHGINGWCLAVGRGVLRSMYCQNKLPANIIQADLVVNGIILLAYERGHSMWVAAASRSPRKWMEAYGDWKFYFVSFFHSFSLSTVWTECRRTPEPLFFNISERPGKPLSWKQCLESRECV